MIRKARLILFTGLLLFAITGVFPQQGAQEAVITELTGTVEIKKAGSAAWENAVRGQVIIPDTVISTGFKSTALISIGSSVLTVRPLTRLSLTELRASRETETINVNLQTGRLKVDVKSPTGTRADFKVQTPSATASVRGTVFEAGIFSLWVIEGSVEYSGTSGAPVIVDIDGYSYVDERTGRAIMPLETMLNDLALYMPIGTDVFYSYKGVPQGFSSFDFIGELGFD